MKLTRLEKIAEIEDFLNFFNISDDNKEDGESILSSKIAINKFTNNPVEIDARLYYSNNKLELFNLSSKVDNDIYVIHFDIMEYNLKKENCHINVINKFYKKMIFLREWLIKDYELYLLNKKLKSKLIIKNTKENKNKI